jgi:cellulose/xylan binding protein with CBM9 domain
MMCRARIGRIPLAVLFLVCTVSIRAQTPSSLTRRLTAVRLQPNERIILDGRLSEEAWRRADPAADFRQQDPQNGEPATEQTEVRVLYDEHRILLGVRCLDSEPARLFGNQMQRDQSLASDDRFMFAIDTYSDGRSGYYFEINPSGAMGDGLVLPGNGIQVNRSWDGIWDARVERDNAGWTAEIKIPLRTITFDPAATSWGINFQRTVRRKTEESLWNAWARNKG